jgi:subtilisin family serine protease
VSIDSTPHRWAMGPAVDPGFAARVERIAAAPERQAREEFWLSGYVELVADDPLQSLVAILAQIYGQAPTRANGKPRTLVAEIRYLTTNPECGIALPMSSFMPQRADKPEGAHGASLESALAQLHKATGNRLKKAKRIGLTVAFDLEVIARTLRPLFSPDPEVRKSAASIRWTDADMQLALFGELARERSFGVQKIGLAGGFSPQLNHAQCLLQTPAAAAPQDYGIAQTGRNTIVGIVDFGCDFAHPSFRTGARLTGSRILALWDQNQHNSAQGVPPVVNVNGVPCGFGYGALFTRSAIEAALTQWLATPTPDPAGPYALLGYDPHAHHFTAAAPGSVNGPDGAHGTFVMEAAAGGRRTVPQNTDPAAQPCGVAPDAEIVFVQVRVRVLPDGRRELDLDDVLHGVAFIFKVAESKGLPCVVNLSLNTMSGPHDGDGHFDRELAALLRSGNAGPNPDARGRAVVIAAGNVPDSSVQALRWQHFTDQAAAGTPVTFHWRMAPKDLTRNVVEIWYDATDAWLQVTLVAPNQHPFGPVKPGERWTLTAKGHWVGSVMGSQLGTALDADGMLIQTAPVATAQQSPEEEEEEEDDQALAQEIQAPANPAAVPGRHIIRLELGDVARRPVKWTVVVEPVPHANPLAPVGQPVRFHAWLERDDEGPSGLAREGQPPLSVDARDRPCTIGTLSCGPDAIVVGGYSTSSGHLKPWKLSGRGPSRRGDIFKPDLAAPAHYVTLIRSRRGNGLAGSLARVTGTSVAAPFVTGTIACIYQAVPTATLADVRKALVETAQSLPGQPAMPGLTGQPAGWNPVVGHGRLNPAGVLARFT